MLVIHRSNCVEKLADALCDFIKNPLESPFAEEIVVVQNNGMAQWLSFRIADRLGVAANIRFPFPASYIWELFRIVLPDLPESSPFDVKIMTWRLMTLLNSLDEQEIFAPITSYLKNGDDLRLHKLAWRIAGVLNAYLTYRQEWLRKWEDGDILGIGKNEIWEAELWRRVAVQEDGGFRRHPREKFFLKLEDEIPDILPKRITLFAISHIPPVYLEIFLNLSKYTEIGFFLFSPSIHSANRCVPEHYDASRASTVWDRVTGCDPIPRPTIRRIANRYYEQGCDSLLHFLQSEILNNSTDLFSRRGSGKNSFSPYVIDKNDSSLQIHSCHSAKRELEVLHNYILDLLNKEKDLKLSDIVVLTPDIESYAPYIEAVFASTEPRIPYNVIDRSQCAVSKLIEGFMLLLDLPKSRFEASKIMALLENAAIKRRFNFSEDDLSKVSYWINENSIRWGIDATHRKKLKLPVTVEHTWRAGLDRLLLGFALPCKEQKLFQDIISYDDIEGNIATTLGKLNNFLEALFKLTQELAIDRAPIDWASYLAQVLGNFLDAEDTEKVKAQILRRVLNDLGRTSSEAGFTDKISVEAIKESLQTALDLTGGAGFLSGKVTFSTLTLMEAIPHKVICLIGMNDGIFPHIQKMCSFNLMIENPKDGDRIQRNEDRYIFIESLVSARSSIFISYTGQNIRDNSSIPPSVIVNELLEVLDENCSMQDGSSVTKHLVIRHPLQPFSKRYFSGEDNRLFSYSKEFCLATREAVPQGPSAQIDNPKLFLPEKLDEPSSEWRKVELEQLLQFYESPARFFLKERLGIRLEEGEDILKDREPFALQDFADADVRKQLLPLILNYGKRDNLDLDNLQKITRGKGLLPHGEVGNVLFNQQMRVMENFLSRMRDFQSYTKIEPLEISIHIEGMHLTGWLHNITNKGWLYYEPVKFYYKHMNFWVHHLLLNLLAPETNLTSSWIAEDKIFTLPVMDNAAAKKHIGNILKYYWEGLSEPLRFFPKSSLAYANKIKKINFDVFLEKDMEDGIRAAKAIWDGNDFSPGESEKPYYKLAFRDMDPIDNLFCQASKMLLLPMLQILEEKEKIE